MIIPFFLFLKTFELHNVHNMLAILLDPRFKFLRIVENYVGCGAPICLTSKYDAKAVIPLLMACFDRLNPTSQACVTIINVFNSQSEKEGNMFSVRTSMEESSHAFVVGELYLFRRLSIFAFTSEDPLFWWRC